MSAISDALESEVAAIRALPDGSSPRQRRLHDLHFARIMRLIAPRVRHFTRTYGLVDMAEDAQQACAIGVHRAIGEYDPSRAKFTTFVNWQLRCELQALRHRVRLDSRGGARKVGARTVSLDAIAADDGGHGPMEIEDASALTRVEAATADRLAIAALATLLDRYECNMRERALRDFARRAVIRRATLPGTVHPSELAAVERDLAMERTIVTRYVFADSDRAKFDPDHPLDKEKQRQISRRVLRNLRARMDQATIN
ncbi:sigma factor [Croceicoccus sp. BE223]|uniref:sigma factor n=1 Tax=Croceicoccus sp. BE223 TaxID=2817716 RepID=UPI0028598FBE|nr:sigma factor [Croceicoccus sp. BE223]MDR7102235.1 RNA polymerase sigma-32 factor [Croceicoccus sp. BE223]